MQYYVLLGVKTAHPFFMKIFLPVYVYIYIYIYIYI